MCVGLRCVLLRRVLRLLCTHSFRVLWHSMQDGVNRSSATRRATQRARYVFWCNTRNRSFEQAKARLEALEIFEAGYTAGSTLILSSGGYMVKFVLPSTLMATLWAGWGRFWAAQNSYLSEDRTKFGVDTAL